MKVRMAGSSLFNPELALVINAPIYSPIPLKNTYDTSNPSQSTGILKSCKGMLIALPVASMASSATMTLIFSQGGSLQEHRTYITWNTATDSRYANAKYLASPSLM